MYLQTAAGMLKVIPLVHVWNNANAVYSRIAVAMACANAASLCPNSRSRWRCSWCRHSVRGAGQAARARRAGGGRAGEELDVLERHLQDVTGEVTLQPEGRAVEFQACRSYSIQLFSLCLNMCN